MKVHLGVLAGMNPELGTHLMPLAAPPAEEEVRCAESRRTEMVQSLLANAVAAAKMHDTEYH